MAACGWGPPALRLSSRGGRGLAAVLFAHVVPPRTRAADSIPGGGHVDLNVFTPRTFREPRPASLFSSTVGCAGPRGCVPETGVRRIPRTASSWPVSEPHPQGDRSVLDLVGRRPTESGPRVRALPPRGTFQPAPRRESSARVNALLVQSVLPHRPCPICAGRHLAPFRSGPRVAWIEIHKKFAIPPPRRPPSPSSGFLWAARLARAGALPSRSRS